MHIKRAKRHIKLEFSPSDVEASVFAPPIIGRAAGSNIDAARAWAICEFLTRCGLQGAAAIADVLRRHPPPPCAVTIDPEGDWLKEHRKYLRWARDSLTRQGRARARAPPAEKRPRLEVDPAGRSEQLEALLATPMEPPSPSAPPTAPMPTSTYWTILSGEEFCSLHTTEGAAGPDCVTDGEGEYGNQESCTIRANVPLFATATASPAR